MGLSQEPRTCISVWLRWFVFYSVRSWSQLNSSVPISHVLPTMASYGNTGDWQPSPPWQETPLASLQSLRGLIQSPPEALQQQLPDSFPNVQGLMDGILQHIMEEAKTMTRTLGTVYAECRYDYGNGREYARIWKCIQVKPYQSKDYSTAHPTQEGEYSEWQKMTNIDIHIRRTWKAQNDWQMLTKTKEEQTTLSANDDPREPINVPTTLQNAIESSSSHEKQNSANRIMEMSRNHLMQSFSSNLPCTLSRPESPPNVAMWSVRPPRGACVWKHLETGWDDLWNKVNGFYNSDMWIMLTKQLPRRPSSIL